MFLNGDNDAEIAEVELLEAVVVLHDWHEKAEAQICDVMMVWTDLRQTICWLALFLARE